jgi:hypothetical protein
LTPSGRFGPKYTVVERSAFSQYTYIVLYWYSPFHRASRKAEVVICHTI